MKTEVWVTDCVGLMMSYWRFFNVVMKCVENGKNWGKSTLCRRVVISCSDMKNCVGLNICSKCSRFSSTSTILLLVLVNCEIVIHITLSSRNAEIMCFTFKSNSTKCFNFAHMAQRVWNKLKVTSLSEWILTNIQ